jgi:hypothetical protein
MSPNLVMPEFGKALRCELYQNKGPCKAGALILAAKRMGFTWRVMI